MQQNSNFATPAWATYSQKSILSNTHRATSTLVASCLAVCAHKIRKALLRLKNNSSSAQYKLKLPLTNLLRLCLIQVTLMLLIQTTKKLPKTTLTWFCRVKFSKKTSMSSRNLFRTAQVYFNLSLQTTSLPTKSKVICKNLQLKIASVIVALVHYAKFQVILEMNSLARVHSKNLVCGRLVTMKILTQRLRNKKKESKIQLKTKWEVGLLTLSASITSCQTGYCLLKYQGVTQVRLQNGSRCRQEARL